MDEQNFICKGIAKDLVEELRKESVLLEQENERNIWFYEENNLRSRIENFSSVLLEHPEKFPAFHKVLQRADALASEKMGVKEVTLWKEKINFKKPGSNGFVAHQDAQAGWEDVVSKGTSFLNIGIAIDACTEENGCLEVIPGSFTSLLGPVFDNLPKDILDEWDREKRWRKVPLRPGDAVVFDSFQPHRSMKNRTSSQRRLLLLTYISGRRPAARRRYHLDKAKNYPPKGHLPTKNVPIRGYKI